MTSPDGDLMHRSFPVLQAQVSGEFSFTTSPGRDSNAPGFACIAQVPGEFSLTTSPSAAATLPADLHLGNWLPRFPRGLFQFRPGRRVIHALSSRRGHFPL